MASSEVNCPILTLKLVAMATSFKPSEKSG